jgi:MinD-like ATPase involved in chromosome partitioning or flagellar assembly
MAADRFVVLGLAGVRTAWFGDVARWATSATLPVDFVKVVSLEEARARLRSGRPFSALLVDAGLAALDRDLVELAATHGCAVVAADDGRAARPWPDLGVHAVLPAGFGPEQLLDALRAVARPIGRRDEATAPTRPDADDGPGTWRGRLVAVTGAGGTGRSTLAMALATGLAADPRDRRLVLLADLALDAHQALMHDAGDVVPGVLELVEAYRGALLPPEEVRGLCFSVPDRGYDLLLGLRRHRDWTALRPRALRAALDGLCRTYRQVVADVDADVEGDDQCGSTDVEDRNMLARQALGAANLVLVVGLPGVVGVHAQLRVVRDLVELGVDAGRIVPVVNRAPRSPRARAEVGSALTALLAASAPDVALASSPVFVPERRRLAEAVRDGLPPPAPLVGPLVGAVRGLLDRARHSHAASRPVEAARVPVPVAPGSLGSWSLDEESGAGADDRGGADR